MSSESYSSDEEDPDEPLLVLANRHLQAMENSLAALKRMEKRYAEIAMALRLLVGQFEFLRKQVHEQIEGELEKEKQKEKEQW